MTIGRPSLGIGGKLLGKGFEAFIGKRKYNHSFRIVKISIGDLDGPTDFSLLELEVAIRW